jgi:DNA gyrase subunit A
VAGVKLAKTDTVIAVAAVSQADAYKVAVITDGQNAKASNLEDYPLQGRATGGVRCVTMKKGDSQLLAAVVTASTPCALDARYKVVEHDWSPVRRDASGQPVSVVTKTLAAPAL